VPTLAALAATCAAPRGPVAALLDARRGEVYAAAHRAGDPLAPPLWGPSLLRPELLAQRLEAGWTLVGDGVPVVADAVRARLGDRVDVVGPPAGRADAAVVGRLGALALAAGYGIAAAELAPVYGRRAAAEERRLGHFDTSRKLS
jgi:tRNA threonylcarbamoyladenosine biosynthesis protein TsaB